MRVPFAPFGTPVEATTPADEHPAAAVADALRERGVGVPAGWRGAYAERHVDAPAGAEAPLQAHVAVALRSRGVEAPGSVVRRAVVAAFDPTVDVRPGAHGAVAPAPLAALAPFDGTGTDS